MTAIIVEKKESPGYRFLFEAYILYRTSDLY